MIQKAVNLYQYNYPAELWANALRPWIQHHNEGFWESDCQAVLLVPDFGWINQIKTNLLAESIPLLGTRILTPGIIRKEIVKKRLGKKIFALYEDLELLLYIASRKAESVTPETLRLLKQDARSFLEAWDQLTAAGYSCQRFAVPWIRQTAEHLESLLEARDMMTTFQADQALKRISENNDRDSVIISDNLFMCGFDAGHWSLLPLLLSVINSSRAGTMAIQVGTDHEQSFNWLGTWEEICGEAEYINEYEMPEDHYPFRPLADSFRSGLPGSSELSSSNLQFLMTGNKAEEAETIFYRVLDLLKDDPGASVAILCPARAIVAREIASLLTEHDIPFNDGHGYYPAPEEAQLIFIRWVAWQQQNNLSSFFTFLQSLMPALGKEPGLLPVLEKGLRESFEHTLTDNYEVNAAWIRKNRCGCVLDSIIREFILLEQSASIPTFLTVCREALKKAGLPHIMDNLATDHPFCQKSFIEKIERSAFLQWLEGILKTPGKSRSARGREPFAQIQLLTYDQIAHQQFDHVVLGSLNQGDFPMDFRENPFLRDTQKNRLNNEVTIMSRYGSGQSTVNAAHGILPTVDHKKTDARNRLAQLTESARQSLTITAVNGMESGSASGMPGEFYLGLAYSRQGTILSDEDFHELTATTRNWLHSRRPVSQDVNVSSRVEKFQKIHETRSNSDSAFGEYEFSYRELPAPGLLFAAKTWENVIRTPASVWFSNVLKVNKPSEFDKESNWALIKGTWIHNWLKLDPAGIFYPMSDKDSRNLEVEKQARRSLAGSEEAWLNSGHPLPDWWRAIWEEARHSCDEILSQLCNRPEWRSMASELSIPQPLVLHQWHNLPLSGRIDLVLTREQKTGAAPDEIHAFVKNQDIWIIDFKTSSGARPLRLPDLLKGRGLQLALYALALEGLEASQIHISILAPDMMLKPQLNIGQLQALESILKGLSAIQSTGIIGMHGPMRSDYTFTGNFPIATLPVDQDILKQKWIHTHPDLEGVVT